MSIPFTQYLRPNGRKNPVTVDRPDEIEALAQKILQAGYRFECEVLTTGQVSFTVVGPLLEDPTEEGDVDIEVVPNGPGVPPAVDKLITRFAERLANNAADTDT